MAKNKSISVEELLEERFDLIDGIGEYNKQAGKLREQLEVAEKLIIANRGALQHTEQLLERVGEDISKLPASRNAEKVASEIKKEEVEEVETVEDDKIEVVEVDQEEL